jgi:hypothetical protein
MQQASEVSLMDIEHDALGADDVDVWVVRLNEADFGYDLLDENVCFG